MNKADALLVDCDEEELRVVGVRRLLHLEEGGAEGGPPVDHLEEGYLGVLGRHTRVHVVGLDNLALPVLGRHALEDVDGQELAQHVRQRRQLLFALAELDPVYEGGEEGGLLPGGLVVAAQ